jgi:hypothetical protein
MNKKYITVYLHYRPYLVTIEGDNVRVYTADRHVYTIPNFLNDPLKYAKHYNKLQCTFRAKKIFIGGEKSTIPGNTILLQIAKCRYVYIGKMIYEFTTMAEINELHSSIGEDDFTFPIAYDTMGNIYIMNDKLIIINHKNLKLKEVNKAYRDKKLEKMKKIKMKLKRIHNLRIK